MTTVAIAAIAAYMVLAWILDVVVHPWWVARAARAAANRRGKPLLNVGAGTRRTSLRTFLLGPTLWGDLNLDLAGEPFLIPAFHPEIWAEVTEPDRVYRADAHDLPLASKAFGAVISSHMLEHVRDPWRCLEELERVAAEVFVITPAWWAPHTWLQVGHRWYVGTDGVFYPLWQRIGRPS